MKKISFETINERLGYDFLAVDDKHWENIETEYDGPNPSDVLTKEEKEFYYNYLLEKLEESK